MTNATTALTLTGTDPFKLPDPARWGRFLLGIVQRLHAVPAPAAPALAAAALQTAQRPTLPRDLDCFQTALQ